MNDFCQTNEKRLDNKSSIEQEASLDFCQDDYNSSDAASDFCHDDSNEAVDFGQLGPFSIDDYEPPDEPPAERRKFMKEQAFDLGQSYDEFLDKMVANVENPVERRIEKTRIAIREIKLSCEDKCSRAKTQDYNDYCQCLKKLPDPDYCHLLELNGSVPDYKSKYVFRSVPGLLDIQVVFHGHAGQVELEFLFKKSGEKISFSKYDGLPDEVLKQLPPRKWKIVIDRQMKARSTSTMFDYCQTTFHYNDHHIGRMMKLIGLTMSGDNKPSLIYDPDWCDRMGKNQVSLIADIANVEYVTTLVNTHSSAQ